MRYRIISRGVHDTQAPAHDITPSDYIEWSIYLDWLSQGNVPDPPLATPPTYATLTAQRVEMLARLDALLDEKRAFATFVAVGHLWKLSPAFLALLTLCVATTPPIPGGFFLPDANRVQVPLNNADLRTVANAARDRLLAVGSVGAAFVIAINSSATPMMIDITVGWP